MNVRIPEQLVDYVVRTRREIHALPELGFQERRTAQKVAADLRRLGIDTVEGIAKTGVVGVIKGGRPGKTVMLRADMDALPMTEENDVTYRSQVNGAMHACGHDGHVAILLGAAELLAPRRDEIAGTVVLCFQPAEEGLGGAREMVREGILERFGIEHAYGLHLNSSHDTGTLAFCGGPMYASSDQIEITVRGVGGHGAAPHMSIDPIYAAGSFIVALQQVVSRAIDPTDPAVVSICSIHGGTTTNVIPSSVVLRGTVRAHDAGVRAKMAERIERVLRGTCEAAGATYDFQYVWNYPVTSNDPAQASYARDLAEQTVGADHVVDFKPFMGGEDFSFFAERVPSCFWQLGSRGDERSAWPHHHERFDIDERALEQGVKIMTAIGLDAGAHAP